MVALTFDDGPDPLGTLGVLDALAEARLRATFFVCTKPASDHPELLARVLEEGHDVQLHGHDHLRHADAGRAAIARDTDTALEVLDGAGVSPTWWRPPWGAPAPWTAELAAERGLRLIRWTVETYDWRGDDPRETARRLRPALGDRDVVLMHDGVGPGALRSDAVSTATLVRELAAILDAVDLQAGTCDQVHATVHG
ncbi:MAG: polysaccharide deacetylase family protein [Solirubrobacterales bacterium]